jgi:sodium-dependent phosphate transporter
MTKIFLSWIISPGLSGIIASFIFLATKHSVLCHKNSLRRGIFAIPIYFFIALGICTFFVINKAPGGINLAKKGTAENWRKALILTGILSVVYALLCLVFLVPFFKRKLIDEEDMKWYHVFMPWVSKQPHNPNLAKQMAIRAGHKVEEDEISDMKLASTPKSSGLKGALTHGLTVDVVSVRSDRIQKVHDEAEKFDAKTEYLFSFLQVCTAAFASFAHGSNDVANAAGPLAGIYAIYISGDLPDEKSVSVPIWILVLMGFAIDVGLSTFGYNVMRNLGNNITYQSPARGFSMELGTSLTVVTASFLGIPVSTTHCITGATVAVGIVAGNFRAINWRMVSWTIFSWLLTLPVVGLISGLLFLALKGTV